MLKPATGLQYNRANTAPVYKDLINKLFWMGQNGCTSQYNTVYKLMDWKKSKGAELTWWPHTAKVIKVLQLLRINSISNEYTIKPRGGYRCALKNILKYWNIWLSIYGSWTVLRTQTIP